jgi:hypothetical protein
MARVDKILEGLTTVNEGADSILKSISSNIGSGWVYKSSNDRMGSYEPCIEKQIKGEKYFFISIDGNNIIFFTYETVENKDYSGIYTDLENYSINLKALGKIANNYTILGEMCLSIFNEAKKRGFPGEIQRI